jgi:16S rRNA (uracil1498-N3)-methyltransferase
MPHRLPTVLVLDAVAAHLHLSELSLITAAPRRTRPRRLHPWASPFAGIRRSGSTLLSSPNDSTAPVLPVRSPPRPRPPRFYVPPPLPAAPGLVRLPLDESRHATRTLRLREGDAVELCDGQGRLSAGEIAAVDTKGALVRCEGASHPFQPRGWQLKVAAACGSLKGGRADWLVEKCAELGAAGFVPLLTERSPAVAGADADSKTGAGREGRWHRVAVAAMKQSLRAKGMAVEAPIPLVKLAESLKNADLVVVGVGGAPPARDVFRAAIAAAHAAEKDQNESPAHNNGTDTIKRGVLIVGPEGDFTPKEVEILVAAGAQPVGLGGLRLRAETAAVALLAYARMELDGDCGGEPYV